MRPDRAKEAVRALLEMLDGLHPPVSREARKSAQQALSNYRWEAKAADENSVYRWAFGLLSDALLWTEGDLSGDMVLGLRTALQNVAQPGFDYAAFIDLNRLLCKHHLNTCPEPEGT